MRKQKGIVLFFSLIVLIIMTVIGVALAVNSGQSLRMSGAGAERVEALVAAQGAQDRSINTQQGAVLANLNAAVTVADGTLNVSSTIVPVPLGDVSCQRSTKANSANLISCRRAEVSSTIQYGRNNLGQLTVVAGIEQEVLTGS
ncbi:pilus assembly PilX N-terminal domain-containing protein [Shewanella cyperi]|uniref:Pilus assembly PilX N-terminal domain-containing protein n=2 Tax=Shewanella TaxID=22 RepID=A0A974XM64_9GAMM|nr:MULTISPECIES: pilus assembly PilX N-terminal domain-containing protein [Shewanella]QSX30869.1 pilus assembly PilX N-terminal domain-containing protein [Shewanella cyperi]QSX38087.1 pilus assembly PilX N-terminal domain-containing protein [Shewanella sedimentimangrovi]